MNTLWFTTPGAKIAEKTRRSFDSKKFPQWQVTVIPSGSLGKGGGAPAVAVVRVGIKTRPSQLKSVILKLAHLQTGAPREPYVLFDVEKGGTSALRDEINSSLSAFPNPDRVDVMDSAGELPVKLSLVEAKLKIAPPRPSPLDEVKQIMEATSDLRAANGNLSATAVAETLGISLSRLANWLDRTRQALFKTPAADSLQDELAFFERVARLRAVVKKEGFLQWLRMPNPHLDNKKPLALLAGGERQVVADLVDDMLTGMPT